MGTTAIVDYSSGTAATVDSTGALKVTGPSGGGSSVGYSSFAVGQVTLTTTAAALVVAARTGASGTGRGNVTIVNESTTAISFGGSGVTFTTGLVLPGVVGASITLQTTAALYGSLQSAGSALVSYIEQY